MPFFSRLAYFRTLVWLTALGSTVSCVADLTPMSSDDACADALNAFAARVLECTGDPDTATNRYERLKNEYGCRPVAEDSLMTTFGCSASISQISCDAIQRYGDDLGMLFFQTTACAQVFGSGTADLPTTFCAQIFQTVETAVLECSWEAVDRSYFLDNIKQYLACETEYSADAVHACLASAEKTPCTESSLTAANRLLLACPDVLRKAVLEPCEQTKMEAADSMATQCSVSESTALEVITKVFEPYTCAPTAENTESCARRFRCPAVDMQDLDSVARLALNTSVCTELLDPCSQFSLKLDNLVFGCTGHEQLAAQVGAAFRASFQCTPTLRLETIQTCTAKLGCVDSNEVEAWLDAFRAQNESKDPLCAHLVSSKTPGAAADAGTSVGGDQ